jgi:hypothetical protein
MAWHLSLLLNVVSGLFLQERRHAFFPDKQTLKMAEIGTEVWLRLLTDPQKSHRCYKNI